MSNQSILDALKSGLPDPDIEHILKDIAENYGKLTVHSTGSFVFSDIADFTRIVNEAVRPNKPGELSMERIAPATVGQLGDELDAYLDKFAGFITDNCGICNKFIGDAVFGIFNVREEGTTMFPVRGKNDLPTDRSHAKNALQTALTFLSFEITNPFPLFKGNPKNYYTRVGVSCPPPDKNEYGNDILLGCLARRTRPEFTAIGRQVNLTARLESLNKDWGTQILFSEGIFRTIFSDDEISSGPKVLETFPFSINQTEIMLFGHELHGIINRHFQSDFDLKRAFEGDLISIDIIQTYGWNDFTFLIHGANFKKISDYVNRRIRALRLRDIQAQMGENFFSDGLKAKLSQIGSLLEELNKNLGFPEELKNVTESEITNYHIFSYTDTLPGMDYGLYRAIANQVDGWEIKHGWENFATEFFAERIFGEEDTNKENPTAAAVIKKRVLKQFKEKPDLEQGKEAFSQEIIWNKILKDMLEDYTGFLSSFTLKPGHEQDFLELFHRSHPVTNHGDFKDIFARLLGRSDLVFEMTQREAVPFLSRIALIIGKLSNLADESTGKPRRDEINNLVISIYTYLSNAPDTPEALETIGHPHHLFKLLAGIPADYRVDLTKERAKTQNAVEIVEMGRQEEIPKALVHTIANMYESYLSYIRDPNLFSHFVDLYIPFHTVMRSIDTGGYPDKNALAEALHGLARSFKARFRASHRKTEMTETTILFKAHTVAPLDAIQCVIDVLVNTLDSMNDVSGFPLISAQTGIEVTRNKVFAVLLNPYHVLFPEHLISIFHEIGHSWIKLGFPEIILNQLNLSYEAEVETIEKDDSKNEEDLNDFKDSFDDLRAIWANIVNLDESRAQEVWEQFVASRDPGLVPSAEFFNLFRISTVKKVIEEVLCDILMNLTVLKNDWDLFRWYYLVLIELEPSLLHESTRNRKADFVEAISRLYLVRFLIHNIESDISSGDQAIEKFDFEDFEAFFQETVLRSRKFQKFRETDPQAFDHLRFVAWGYCSFLVRPEISFKTEKGSWFVDQNFDLGISRKQFVHQKQKTGKPERIKKDRIDAFAATVLVSITRIMRGLFEKRKKAVSESTDPPDLLLKKLVKSVRSGEEFSSRLNSDNTNRAYNAAFFKVCDCLHALIEFFYRNNRGDAQNDFPHLSRYEPTGGEGGIEVTIDTRSGFFFRSYRASQEGFAYRHAVLRELTNLHHQLRTYKLNHIMKNLPRKEGKREKDH